MDLEVISDEESQVLYDTDQVKDWSKKDMDFFASLCLPNVVSLDFPSWYVWLWSVLVGVVLDNARGFPKYAIGLPRGHGKTMVVKLLIAFAILFSDRKYILVVGANAGKAEAIISDICEILSGENINSVFGSWKFDLSINRQDLKKFTFNGRTVILEAAGYGTAIRGSNRAHSRPDIILFDDSQTKECAESIVEAQKYQKWFVGTAMKSKSPSGCIFLYIGNMYKDMKIIQDKEVYACMLRNLQLSPSWVSMIVGGILQDGTALWEELHPIDVLLEEFAQDQDLGQEEIFFAEVLNDPEAQTSHFIDINEVVSVDYPEMDLHEGNFIVIDPATSKDTPDQIVIGYHEIFDGIPYLVDMIVGKFGSPQIVEEAFKMAQDKQCALIVVESNAFQYSLIDWANFLMHKFNVTWLRWQPLYNAKRKHTRITGNLFKALISGRYKLTKKVAPQVKAQALAYNPQKSNNLDDILDMCEMGIQTVAAFRGFMVASGDLSLNAKMEMSGIPSQKSDPSPSAF